MENENRRQLKDIFDRARRQDASERERFVREKCGADADLRAEILSLLDSFESLEDFMEQPAIAEVADVIVAENRLADGQSFAQYRIVARIGAGGMGEVYLAEDSKLERLVALKILNEKFSRREINRARFIREAKAASSLNHPNIITIYEINHDREIHYIASEFISGKTLREILGGESLNLSEILDISIQIAGALSAAHEADLIHRDIKPENVIVRPDGLVKVLDFGLAKAISKNDSTDFENESATRHRTADGIILGTVNYMSPEQARGETLDERTDIFSLGVVVYEMIAGKNPFGGDSMAETWANLFKVEPPPLARDFFAVPDEIERVVFKMLRKQKEARYQNARDLIFDLQSLKKHLEQNADLQTGFPAIKPLAANTHFANAVTDLMTPPNNLTKNFAPIIGRQPEIEEITGLLRQDAVNLVTLTGIGGVGKTTLSQIVAAALLPDFFDGVYFIELAALSDPEAVVAAVAQTLGLNEAGGKSIGEILKNFLKEKRMLLVLDNFEQVIDAAPAVADLLAAGKLKILATSRMPLHLSREREFPVQPLDVPARNTFDFHSTANAELIEELERIEAVKLFVERARKAKPNFALTFDNAARVAEICARLEGLPLAIELAAARVKILSPAAISSKLENSLNLLTGGARDLPVRQQTMRGALQWSYDLLSADEKLLFRRLSVFRGGFTFEAAENIAAAAPKNDAPALDVLESLSSLVDKSLLVAKEQARGEMRFRMLEVVREYALESSQTSGETASIQRRHAEFFLRLGERAEPHLQGADSVKWIDALENEHDNLREALSWSLKNDAAIAVRLAAAIRHLWAVHAHLAEGCRWIEAVLERGADEIPTDLKFKLTTWLGLFTRHRGDYRTAEKIFQKGLAEGEAARNSHHIATFNRCLGAMAFQESDFNASRRYLEAGLTISREIEDLKGIAYSLVFLGDVDRIENNLTAARPLFEEALTLLEKLGDKQAASVNLCNLGAVAYSENDYEISRRYYAEAFSIAGELSDKQAMSYALDGFAALAAKNEDYERAARCAGIAESLRESINSAPELAERRFRDEYLAELKRAIGDDEFIKNSERGKKLKIEEIYRLVSEEF